MLLGSVLSLGFGLFRKGTSVIGEANQRFATPATPIMVVVGRVVNPNMPVFPRITKKNYARGVFGVDRCDI